MTRRTWTKENDAFIIIERSNNTPYAELATKFNRKFNSKVKVTDLHQRAFKLNITGNTVKAARKPNKVTKALASPKPQKKYFIPTQEQINFVHSSFESIDFIASLSSGSDSSACGAGAACWAAPPNRAARSGASSAAGAAAACWPPSSC